MKTSAQLKVISLWLLVHGKMKIASAVNREPITTNQYGFSSLAAVTLLGLTLALFLALVGTGIVNIPGTRGIPVSPIPFSDPVEDDEACNDEFNADCEKFLERDPENLTQSEIAED